MLYRSLRVHTIFGANTEIGKTIFSTALCRTSLALGEKVSYLKPVGTGNTDEGDDGCERFMLDMLAWQLMHPSTQTCGPLQHFWRSQSLE